MNLLFQAAQQARLIRERQELIFWTTAGPATTFDPKITGVAGTWFFDDGTTLAATSGAEISKTFAADGLHRAVFRPGMGGLAAITQIDCGIDLITNVIGLDKLIGITKYQEYSSHRLNFNIIPVSKLNTLDVRQSTVYDIEGDINLLPAIQYLYLNSPLVVGKTSLLPADMLVLVLSGCFLVECDDLTHMLGMRDLRLQSGYLTVVVDDIIDQIWGVRANWTYATPALQIGGTNQAPTGNVIAPVEGADWHQDGATWIPLTTGAKAYDLAKDVNGEGFNKWTITYTGGSIAP